MTDSELMPDEVYCALITALNWVYEADVKAIAAIPDPDSTRCDRTCPGWALFDEGRGMGLMVERCDDCDRFQTDTGAMNHVMMRLGEEMAKRHFFEVDRDELEHLQERYKPVFITDNGGGFTVVNADGTPCSRVPRYGLWAKTGSGKLEVAETSDDLEYLRKRWGQEIPFHIIEASDRTREKT